MKKSVLLILMASLFFGCIPNKSTVSVNFGKTKNANQTSSIPSATVSSVEIINNQLVITGNGLTDVTNVKVGGTSFNENFAIESKSATKIIANSIRAFSFDVTKVFSLIISDAYASATFPIDFSLCNATLNGKGFNCAAPVSDKDVLAYDAVSGKWKPRPASGLNYLGTFDASSNPGSGPAIQPAGAYYVISDDGTIGAVSFAVGDWLVSNGSTWQKIDNSTAVLSVHGRFGAITAQKGDYTLDLLGDVSFPVAPVAGKVLKFDGTNWVASDDLAGGGAGSVTTATIAAGAVTDAKIDTVSASKITGAINSTQILDGTIVNADINAAAAIDYSKLNIPNTTIPYAKLNIADGEIPAAKVSGLLTLPTGTALDYYAGDKTLKVLNTAAVPESGTNYYFTDARTRAATLTGLAAGSGNLVAGDSVLGAFGKLLTTQTDYVSKSTNSTVLSELTVSGTGTIVVPTPTLLTHAANMGYVQSYVDAYGQWTKSGSDIYRASGNVGLGTNTPLFPLHILGTSANGSIGVDYYANTTTAGGLTFRKARGTSSAPTAVQSGDYLASFSGRGYGATGFSSVGRSAIVMQATENWTDTTQGSSIVLQTTDNGTILRQDRMKIDNNGNVGLGTMTPETKLDIATNVNNSAIGVGADTSGLNISNHNNTAGSYALMKLSSFGAGTLVSADGHYFMSKANANNDIDFFLGKFTSGGGVQDQLSIKSNGNFGIGTTNPQTLMHLYASDTSFKELRMDAARNNAGAYGISFVKSRGVTGARTAAQANDSLGDLNWSPYVDSDTIVGASARIRAIASENATLTGNGGLLQFMTTPNASLLPVERLRITQDGKLGIGTTAPATSVHIVSDQPATEVHPNRAGFIMESEGTSVGGRMALKVYSNTESPLYVGYHARGTKAAPTGLLSGDQIGGFAAVGYDGSNWQTGAHIRYITNEDWSPAGIGSHISFRTVSSGTTVAPERMRVDHNGNIGIGTSAPDEKLVVFNGTTTGKYTTGGWTHSSDARLKHDISPIEDALNKILKIKGVEYKFNSDPENKTQLGFIAQEVEPIFPEVVQTDKKGFKSMIYSNLIAPLVESVKALYARIIGVEKQIKVQDRQIASKADKAVIDEKVLRLSTENAKLKKENEVIKARLEKIEKALNLK